MSKYQELLSLNNKIQKLINEDIDWETKYDLVFCENVSRRVFKLLKELGVSFDYYDPDTSYEEDLRAFANALKEKVEELEKVKYMFEEE